MGRAGRCEIAEAPGDCDAVDSTPPWSGSLARRPPGAAWRSREAGVARIGEKRAAVLEGVALGRHAWKQRRVRVVREG